MSSGPPNVPLECKVHVSNLPWSTSEAALAQHVESAVGVRLTAARLVLNELGQSRGFAFLFFDHAAAAAAAVRQLNDTVFMGRQIRVGAIAATRRRLVPPSPLSSFLSPFLFQCPPFRALSVRLQPPRRRLAPATA